ncbi:MAG: hypothetical protein P1U86_19965 [Verrucomicrobiales bacterium]|nr:hypothetical protein [Verrucomicrobiales bacterium]
MSVEVVSACGRSDSGSSRPFFCEANDDNFYFVKSGNLSPDDLVREFLISRLAEECGLPVAPVKILSVPEVLTTFSILDEPDDFVAGDVFGSQRIPFADDLRASHVSLIEEETRIRCLCFDWWVRNSNRRLDLLGGDSNLLWDPLLNGVYLIDHSHCLDPEFDGDAFKREHAFRDSRPFIDKKFFKKWRTRFESTIYNLGKLWEEIPESWLVDEEGSSRISFDRKRIEAQLIKPEHDIEGILPH